MKLSDTSAAGKAGQFQTICWAAVLLSAQGQVTAGKASREVLRRRYWYSLYAFIQERGDNPDDASELTQGFFLTLFHRKALRAVTPVQGKFRFYLLARLKNYLSVELPRENAIRKGLGIEFVPLDLESGERA